jgi:hypothetical protein
MSRVNSFYDVFERNVTGLSTDVTKQIRSQVDELLESYPRVRRENVKVEMECRFKNANSDKVLGPLITDLDTTPGYIKSTKEIIDVNYSVGKVRGFNMTVRDSMTDGEKSLYAKTKVFFPRNTPAEKVLSNLESLGLKFSFSLEIESRELCEELLSRNPSQPLKRTKNRISFTDLMTGISFDITKVFQSNTMRTDTELEIDYTTSVGNFIADDPIGRVKSFISMCEEKARTMIYRTRTLIPGVILEDAIIAINKALGSATPMEWKIEKRVPQVRNFTVSDLLKENYKGYGCTPKADGYRYFMVILKTTIILVRPPNIYKVVYEGLDIPPSWEGFVFDGELIERENLIERNLERTFLEGVDNYYCIFDVLTNSPTSGVLGRINHLKSFFEEVRRGGRLGCFSWSNTYNSIYFQPHPNARVKTPVKKTFVEIKPYEDATETTWHSADAFFEELRDKLRYKDDGLIFTPKDSSYVDLNQQENMTLKWKPMEMLSIDFRYKDGDLFMWAQGTEESAEEVPFRGTVFYPLVKEQIVISNPDNVRLTSGNIYEFIFDIPSRTFRVTRPRFDKAMPNTVKDSFQIWTDYNRPMTQNLIRGIGPDGLIECQREAMWTWVEHFLSKAEGPVFDLSDFNPAKELPVRFLENYSFSTLTKNLVLYRLTNPLGFDFPGARQAPSNVNDLPPIDVLIINGQQLCMIEGREGIHISDPNFVDASYLKMLRVMISKSRRVFVRNFAAIIPSELPTMFHPDRACYGQEEELEIIRLDDHTLEIRFKYGGVFYDVSSGGYSSLFKTTAHMRSLVDVQYVSSGHRIMNSNLEDNGPEQILGGKHFGKLFDYLYNGVFPAAYFTPFLQGLFKRVDPDSTPIDDIVRKIEILQLTTPITLEQQPPESTISPLQEEVPFIFNVAFDTVVLEEAQLNTPMEIDRESSKMPVEGDVFEMIAKTLSIIESEIPPKNKTLYDKDVVSKRAAELRLMMGTMTDVNQLTEKVYELLGLGLVFVRRIRNTPLVKDGFRSRFIMPERLNSPRYGFLLIESRSEGSSLLDVCSLLSYQGKFIVHRSDPLLKALYDRPLQEINITREKLKISPSNSGKVKVGSITWPSLHRLFNSMRYVYPDAPETNAEYVKIIAAQSTDNKADYLISMEIPPRFKKQAWAAELQRIIDEYRQRGAKPDPIFEDRAETEFARVLENLTDKSKRDILSTEEAFLFDEGYPGNLYGKGLMHFRSKLQRP